MMCAIVEFPVSTSHFGNQKCLCICDVDRQNEGRGEKHKSQRQEYSANAVTVGNKAHGSERWQSGRVTSDFSHESVADEGIYE